jgi:hypothetical protein
MKNHLEAYKKDFYLFLEGGFVAIKEMDEDSARKLFDVAKLLQPDNPLVYIGYSYIHLCKLELNKAEEFCKKALEYESENETAKSLLGVILSMNSEKMSDGEKILNEAATRSNVKEVKNLANAGLEFIDKVIKKDTSPLEPKQPKQKRK